MSGDFVDSLFISHIGILTNVINLLTFRERTHTTEYLKKTPLNSCRYISVGESIEYMY